MMVQAEKSCTEDWKKRKKSAMKGWSYWSMGSKIQNTLFLILHYHMFSSKSLLICTSNYVLIFHRDTSVTLD